MIGKRICWKSSTGEDVFGVIVEPFYDLTPYPVSALEVATLDRTCYGRAIVVYTIVLREEITGIED